VKGLIQSLGDSISNIFKPPRLGIDSVYVDTSRVPKWFMIASAILTMLSFFVLAIFPGLWALGTVVFVSVGAIFGIKYYLKKKH